MTRVPAAQPLILEPASRRLGVFIVGGRGDIATCVATGAAALARGLIPPVGLVSELADFRDAGLAPFTALRFGGVDIRSGDLVQAARGLATREAGLLPPEVVKEVEPELAAASRRIETGFITGTPPWMADTASLAAQVMRPRTRDAIADAREMIVRFRAAVEAECVVVVHLASTEPRDEEAEALADEESLERRLDDPRVLPPSLVYAIAAQDEGCPYVNFTPSCGARPPALVARAERIGTAIAGRDGKTGETLLKSALAPMFAARNLRVLSWAGYNILGNRDGLALRDPRSKAAKVATKASTLRSILGDRLGTEHVEIQYVPSIGDWKTAWDHIHFEGFLGARMTLELTWRGADSILAAPLVIDLVRLIERARRLGRRGIVPELAAFFKEPAGTDERGLPAQMDLLQGLARAFVEDERRARDAAAQPQPKA